LCKRTNSQSICWVIHTQRKERQTAKAKREKRETLRTDGQIDRNTKKRNDETKEIRKEQEKK
jgi:hypothetical protein